MLIALRSWLFVLLLCIALPLPAQEPPSLSEAERAEVLARAKKLNEEVVVFYQKGKYAEVIPLAREASAAWEKALGPDHPHVAQSLHNLASLVYRQGDKTQALTYMSNSCHILEIQRLKVAGAERERAQFMAVHGS